MSNFYVTTSIPYVNSDPHVGFGMELVMADVIARYIGARQTPIIFSTGTDDHGGKIEEKAKELNITPQELTDQISQKFRELIKLLNISSNRFIRTNDPAHIQRAQIIWKNLSQYIYKGKYSGWYCTGHEEFFPENIVKANKGNCPDHNRPYEKVEEENYFFKLSAFTPKIKQAIDSNSFKIIPSTRRNEILSVINAGLEDISISRPKSKIKWGIPVPGDDNHIMYVWFEALMNYLTVLGYPEHQDFKDYWPANVQVIGKDILRFHAAIWPGMLLGLGLQLPKILYVHGHITIENKKMSKSLGNVVSPKEIVDRFGVDGFRYFFLRHIPSYEDGDFSWDRLEAAYNNELADQLGNAVSRTAAMINNYQKGAIGDIPAPDHDMAAYEEAIENCRFDHALEDIWDQVKGLNQYIEETKPWEIAKTADTDHLKEVLSYAAASLLQIAALLHPFLPDTADKIKTVFDAGVIKPLPGPLFPKQLKKKNQAPAV